MLSAPDQIRRALWLHHSFHEAQQGRIPASRLDEQYDDWGLERKTKLRDLEVLKKWAGCRCVDYDPRTRSWILRTSFDPPRNLTPLPLTDPQAQALQLAQLVVQATQGDGFEAVDSLDDLVRGTPGRIRHVSVFPSARLGYDGGEAVASRWSLLHEAIRQHQRIRFVYPTRNGPRERRVDPLHLWWAQGGWYLLARMSHRPEQLLSYALARMESPAPSIDETSGKPEVYPPDPAFDPLLWLGQGDWLYRGGRSEVARIRFDAESAPSFRDRIWQNDARWEDMPDGRNILLHPYPAGEGGEWEMARRILGWGEYCEVLGPESLRERIRKLLADIAQRYRE